MWLGSGLGVSPMIPVRYVGRADKYADSKDYIYSLPTESIYTSADGRLINRNTTGSGTFASIYQYSFVLGGYTSSKVSPVGTSAVTATSNTGGSEQSINIYGRTAFASSSAYTDIRNYKAIASGKATAAAPSPTIQGLVSSNSYEWVRSSNWPSAPVSAIFDLKRIGAAAHQSYNPSANYVNVSVYVDALTNGINIGDMFEQSTDIYLLIGSYLGNTYTPSFVRSVAFAGSPVPAIVIKNNNIHSWVALSSDTRSRFLCLTPMIVSTARTTTYFPEHFSMRVTFVVSY